MIACITNELIAIPNEVFELPQNVLDRIREMHERWNNWLVLEDFNLAEKYLKGHTGLLVEFDPAASRNPSLTMLPPPGHSPRGQFSMVSTGMPSGLMTLSNPTRPTPIKGVITVCFSPVSRR